MSLADVHGVAFALRTAMLVGRRSGVGAAYKC